jgi:hypothetical protein
VAFGKTQYLKYCNFFEWAAMAEFLLGASLVLTEHWRKIVVSIVHLAKGRGSKYGPS